MPEPNEAATVAAIIPPPTYEISQFRDRQASSEEHEAEAIAARRNEAIHSRPLPTTPDLGSLDQETLRPTSSQPRTNSPMSVLDKVTPIKYLSSKASQWIDCPYCKQRTKTKSETNGYSMQVLVGGLLCLFTICLTPLPCCLHWFEETEWFCTGCKAKVATRVHGAEVIPIPPPNTRLVNSRYSGTLATVTARNSPTPVVEADPDAAAPMPASVGPAVPVPVMMASPAPTHIAHHMVVPPPAPTANSQHEGASDRPPASTTIPAPASPPTLPQQNFIELSTFGPVELPTFPLDRRESDRSVQTVQSDESSAINLPIQIPQPSASSADSPVQRPQPARTASADLPIPVERPGAPSHTASPSTSTMMSVSSNASTAINSIRTMTSSRTGASNPQPDARPDSELLPMTPLPEVPPVELPADSAR